MPRLLAIVFMLLPVAAMAQEVPEEARMDLWCGTAFELVTRDAAADATGEAATKRYADGARLLIQRAIPIYLESGYSDQALAAYRDEARGHDRSRRQRHRAQARRPAL